MPQFMRNYEQRINGMENNDRDICMKALKSMAFVNFQVMLFKHALEVGITFIENVPALAVGKPDSDSNKERAEGLLLRPRFKLW